METITNTLLGKQLEESKISRSKEGRDNFLKTVMQHEVMLLYINDAPDPIRNLARYFSFLTVGYFFESYHREAQN